MEVKEIQPTNWIKVSDPNLQNIPEWVERTFKKEPYVPFHLFNVSCYSDRAKENAIKQLSAAGHVCNLNETQNSLRVFQKEA